MAIGIRPRMRSAAAAVVAGGLLLAPRLADACSVCTAGTEDENRLAFLLTTVFLSVLPLAAIGGGVFWLVRRARALELACTSATQSYVHPIPRVYVGLGCALFCLR